MIRSFSRHSWILALILGALFTIAQIGFVFTAERNFTLEGYLRLYQWDSKHYADIATRGYFSDLPPFVGDVVFAPERYSRQTNVAFFPGYVLAGGIVHGITRLSMRLSFLLASALAAWGFWTMLLLLLRRWRVHALIQCVAILLIIAHPAAFFPIAAYSESLFLFGLIGMIFWAEFASAASAALTVGHGMIMTATRIFGLPLAAYPVVIALHNFRKLTASAAIRSIILSAGATLGGLLFFAYCSVAFGKWNLYMLAQTNGWGLTADPLFLFHNRIAMIPMLRYPFTRYDNASLFTTPILFWLLVLGVVSDLLLRRFSKTPDPFAAQRAGLWVLAFLSFFFSAMSLSTVGFRGMIRYAFIPWILAILAFSLLASRFRWTKPRAALVVLLLVTFALTTFSLQYIFIGLFTNAIWVA